MATAKFPSCSSQDSQAVTNIIQALYSPTTSVADQQALQAQLFEAQKRDEAWGLIGGLLPSDDVNCSFFGAHTAQVKISRDWDSLPENMQDALRDSLIAWTGEISSRPPATANVVLRKLFTALTSFALRVRWPDWLLSLSMHLVGRGLAPDMTLELLTIAVEEVSRADLTGSRKSQMQQSMTDSTDLVVRSVHTSLTRPDANERERLAALKCFESWLAFGLPDSTIGTLFPVFLTLLTDLEALPLFPAVSSAVTDVLGRGWATSGLKATEISRAMLGICEGPLVMSVIQNSLEAELTDDNTQALVKLITAIGDHSAPYIATNLTSPAVQHLLRLALSLTGFPGYPGQDEDVSEISLELWYLLQEALCDSPEIIGDKYSPGWAIAREVFADLVVRLRAKIKWPEATVLSSWTASSKSAFKSYRTVVADTLIAAYYLLREEMLSSLISTLEQELATVGSGSSWEDVEATLQCLRSIQEAIPEDESVYIPRLLGADILGKLPATGDTRVRLTSLLLIDSYSPQLRNHPSLLMPTLSYVVPALSTRLASAAASALRALCNECRTHLTQHIAAFGELHANLGGNVPPEERGKVLQSIVSVVQALPVADAVSPLLTIVEPVVSQLINALRHPGQNPEVARLATIQALTDLFAVSKGLAAVDDDDLEPSDGADAAVEAARADPQLSSVREAIVAASARIAEVWPADVEVSLALSDLLRSLTVSPLEPTLLTLTVPPLLDAVCSAIARSPTAIWLSLAASLINRLGVLARSGPAGAAATQETAVAEMVGSAVDRVWTGAASVLTGLPAMEENPDIVQNFFPFASMVARHFPLALVALPQTLLDNLFLFATTALSVQERFSLKAAADFLTVTICNTRALAPEVLPPLDNLLQARGPQILQAVVVGIAGHSPRSQVPVLAELLYNVLVKLQGEGKAWLEGVLQPDGFPVPRATREAKDKFIKAVVGSRSLRKVKEASETFGLICRGMDGSAYEIQIHYRSTLRIPEALS